MIKRIVLYTIAFIYPCIGVFAQSQYTIVPKPSLLEVLDSQYSVDCNTPIYIDREDDRPIAFLLSSLLKSNEDVFPKITLSKNLNDKGIRFRYISSIPKEGYCMTLSDKGLNIESSSSEGFFYAVESLRQIISQSPKYTSSDGTRYLLPYFKVEDSPRFSYRGMMLDVSRFFMPKEDVLRLIDAMALIKLNKLHLHLTDDNGWRVEIKRYPKLTSVGAYRVDRDKEFFSHRRNQRDTEEATSGGYYTQEDLKDIVRYAKDRMIDIIPEIDIPAHSNAALAAYPEYACASVDKKITVLPGIGEDHYPIIFCAGKEKTYTFLQNILDEVMEIFPYEYIHLGGDEADKTYWKKCTDCQKSIKTNHLKDEEALQGYFMNRISNYVKSKGRKLMGWDEVTNFEIPEGMTVFGWRGNGNAALKAAKRGHNFVMTAAKKLYLIRYQGPQWFEPMTYFGNNTLRDVYEYEPVQPDWDKEYVNLLMGVQACMWTEFCRSANDVFYMVFPRLVALSDVAWSNKGEKDYNEFLKSLDNFLPLLSSMGVNYAKSMYNIQHKAIPNDGNVLVELSSGRPDMDIRYTLDGSMPNNESTKYTSPINITQESLVTAALFKGHKMMGEVLQLPVLFNLATGQSFTDSNKALSPLTNGVRGSIRQSDFEWVTFPTDKPSSFTLNLNEEKEVSEIAISILNNYSMAIHRPKSITVEVSLDNRRYTKVGSRTFDTNSTFVDENSVYIESFKFSKRKVKFVKVTSTPWGVVPNDHVRVGRPSMFYYDELIVK